MSAFCVPGTLLYPFHIPSHVTPPTVPRSGLYHEPISQMKKLRYREGQAPGQGYTAGKWRARCGTEVHVIPNSLLLTTQEFCCLPSQEGVQPGCTFPPCPIVLGVREEPSSGFSLKMLGWKPEQPKYSDIQTVIHPYHEVLPNNKKVTSNKYSNNMDESQKYWAEIKKPDINAYILYDSIYMKLQNRFN